MRVEITKALADSRFTIASQPDYAGFTLIELVVVLLIVGVLAVSALPRLLDRKIFDSRGFSDQAISTLRYAQKEAIGQRRTVCVAFTSTSITLMIASASGSLVCNTNLASPSGPTPYTITANSGVAFVALPTNFQFNALGQASLGQTMSISGASGSITVEQDSGYVHP